MLRKKLLLMIVILGSNVPVFAINAKNSVPAVPVVTLKPTAAQEEAGKYISQ